MRLKVVIFISYVLSSLHVESESLSTIEQSKSINNSHEKLDVDSETKMVTLNFKDNESYKISYSKLKEDECFETESLLKILKAENPCYNLSEFSLEAFKFFTEKLEGKTQFDIIIFIVNYGDLDRIIKFILLLYPKPKKNFFGAEGYLDFGYFNYLRSFGKDSIEFTRYKKNDYIITTDIEYKMFIHRSLSRLTNYLYDFLPVLQKFFENKSILDSLNFIVTYSRYHPFIFEFAENFKLHVKVKDQSLLEECDENDPNTIYILIISNVNEAFDSSLYSDRINFVKNAYLERLGDKFKVKCVITGKIASENSQEFLEFLEIKYEVKIKNEIYSNDGHKYGFNRLFYCCYHINYILTFNFYNPENNCKIQSHKTETLECRQCGNFDREKEYDLKKRILK